MVKMQFCCDSGANIHSCKKSGWLDPVKDLGLDEGEWESYSDEQKNELAEEWASNFMSIYFEEQGGN